jgi:hypothetical protein
MAPWDREDADAETGEALRGLPRCRHARDLDGIPRLPRELDDLILGSADIQAGDDMQYPQGAHERNVTRRYTDSRSGSRYNLTSTT